MSYMERVKPELYRKDQLRLFHEIWGMQTSRWPSAQTQDRKWWEVEKLRMKEVSSGDFAHWSSELSRKKWWVYGLSANGLHSSFRTKINSMVTRWDREELL